MLLLPENYSTASVRQLLSAAASGRIGIDRLLMRAILDKGQGPSRSEVVRELVEYGLNSPPEDRLDISPVIFDLLRALRSSEAIPFYLRFLETDEFGDHDPVYVALAELGADAVEPLLELRAKAATMETQGELEFLLAGLHVHDPRIEALLLARLETEPGDAAISLALYGDAKLLPQIDSSLKKLAAEDPQPERMIQELEFTRRELQNPRIVDQPEEVDIMESYKETALPLLEVMEVAEQLEFAVHPSAQVRRALAESLQDEEPTPHAREVLLRMARSDDDALVRGWALHSLGAYLEEKVVADLVHARLGNEKLEPTERVGAALALVQPGDEVPAKVHQLLRKLYEVVDVRERVLRAMWTTLDKQYTSYMSKHLEDPNAEIQTAAILGVGMLEMGYEAGRLEQFFENEDQREAALAAYALCAPGKFSRSIVKTLLNRIEKLADGLSEEEEDIVKNALDQRLMMHGLEPFFSH